MENKGQCTLSATLNEKEKALLVEVSKELNVPYRCIMRRLIHYILDGKIEWLELIKKTKTIFEKVEKNGDVESSNARPFSVRTDLPLDLYSTFTQLAEEWGSNPNVVRSIKVKFRNSHLDDRQGSRFLF